MLAPFIQEATVALGVMSSQFTVEAYFEPERVPVRGEEEIGPNGLCQHYFQGTPATKEASLNLEFQCSPARHGMDAGRAFEQHISNNKQLFYSGDEPKESVYFRRYAVCPITETCSNSAMGVLVLTSTQDEPFADDVLDTLAFLETLISNFLSAYWRCFYEHNDLGSESETEEAFGEGLEAPDE